MRPQDAKPTHETARDTGDRAGGLIAVRAELAHAEAHRDRAGGDVGDGGGDEQREAAGIPAAEQLAHPHSTECADRREHRPHRRSDGVRGDELTAAHHVRQGGGETGEHEAPDAEHREHCDREECAVVGGRDERHDRHDGECLE